MATTKRKLQLILNRKSPRSKRAFGAQLAKYKWLPAAETFPLDVNKGDEIKIQVVPEEFSLDEEPRLRLNFIPLPDGSPYTPFSKETTRDLSDPGVEPSVPGLEPVYGGFEAVRTGAEFTFVVQLVFDDGVIKWFCDPQMNVDEPDL